MLLITISEAFSSFLSKASFEWQDAPLQKQQLFQDWRAHANNKRKEESEPQYVIKILEQLSDHARTFSLNKSVFMLEAILTNFSATHSLNNF